MGIRFYCPNGHKLNVKSFLAGKRGICPQCSARFRIPSESQIPKDAPKIRPEDLVTPTEMQHAEWSSSAAAPTEQPAPPATAETDPIAEAPQAVWYVRPPSGGQYGPARGDVMQRWITEGRVSSDTLVWREGWPEWRSAGPLFPSLAGDSETTTSNDDDATEIRVETEDEAPSGRRATSPTRSPTRRRHKSVAAVVTLTLIIMALLVVLVVVLQGM
jgi:hypothetical protein